MDETTYNTNISINKVRNNKVRPRNAFVKKSFGKIDLKNGLASFRLRVLKTLGATTAV
tara:strand:- start:327 stop:500 length:174 start_codon:yes stop_codon:yes gene_type:complete